MKIMTATAAHKITYKRFHMTIDQVMRDIESRILADANHKVNNIGIWFMGKKTESGEYYHMDHYQAVADLLEEAGYKVVEHDKQLMINW